MQNVFSIFLRVLLPAISIIASGCNPLVSKTSIDSSFTPGFSTSKTISPIACASSVTTSASTLAADGVASATLTVTLNNGSNFLASKIVTLSSNRGASDVLSASAALTNAAGVATFTVTSTLAGTAIFTAIDSSDGVIVTQQTSITFTAGVADHLVKISGDAETSTVGTVQTNPPKVQVVDRYGNGIGGSILYFLATLGGGAPSSYSVTADSSGYAQVNFKAGAGGNTNTIEVGKIGGPFADLALSGKATVTFSETSNNLGNGSFNALLPNMGPTTAVNPQGMTTGDFNADGFPDVAIAVSNYASIGVLLSNGDGTFQSVVHNTTGSAPYEVIAVDFNADGKLDLVTANHGANTFSILLGNGNGTFGAKTDFATASDPRRLASGDFNADGKIDLAVTNYASNSVSIFLGNGNGTFGAKTDFTTGTGPLGIATKDFNADGKLDLAVSNGSANTLSILLGVGDGTFGAKTDFATGNLPDRIVSADVNNDGKFDLLTTNYNGISISVLFGIGNGTFAAKTDYATANCPWWMQLQDLNADGALDIVATNLFSGASISVLMGNKVAGFPNGTFSTQVEYPSSYRNTPVVVADFNSDGIPDVSTAGWNNVGYGRTTLSFLKGNGDGTFSIPGTSKYTTGSAPIGIISGDFNADGAQDVAVANYASSTVSVFIGKKTLNVPDGTFYSKVDYATGVSPYSLVSGDFNEDGALDLAVANYTGNSVSILTGHTVAGTPDGTFNPKVDFAVGTSPAALDAADFNNDGHIDLVVSNISTNNLIILTGNGAGSFTNTLSLATQTTPRYIVTADFNSDGKKDIAFTNYNSNTMSVFIGNGNGTFLARVDYATLSQPIDLTKGDFNGDGKIDLVVTHVGGQVFNYFPGVGDGTFGAYTTNWTGVDSMRIKTGDFNGDGKLDLISVERLSGNFDIIFGNGNGTFATAPVAYQTNINPYDATTGDFNNDGKIDVITTSYFSNTITVNLGK